jgi:UMP-CMP kinase
MRSCSRLLCLVIVDMLFIPKCSSIIRSSILLNPHFRNVMRHSSTTVHRHTNSNSNNNDNNNNQRIIFLLGGPGSGKGTQCTKLSKELGMIHISAGELLRNEMNKNSEYGILIKKYLDDGKIVPVKITLNLLDNVLQEVPNGRFIIDGFPRNLDNFEGWQEYNNKYTIDNVIFIDCKDDVLTKRLLNRGKTSGRSDDNLIAIQKRLVTYHSETIPIINIYKKMNMLITIDGNSNSINDIFNTIKYEIIKYDIIKHIYTYLDTTYYDHKREHYTFNINKVQYILFYICIFIFCTNI